MNDRAKQDELSNLIERGFHSVVFQPIRHLIDGTNQGFEALMRGPEGTALENPASVFRDGAVDPTLLHALDAACMLSAVRLGRVLPGLLFINVHGETLVRHAEQSASIEHLLNTVNVDPRRVVFEISETTDKTHAAAIKRSLRPLRDRGVRLALDDVGVFNSWLHHMVSLEPEFMKVDRQFISGIDRSPSKTRLLRGFVAFARETGARIVVEGIELPAERDAVIDCGVELAQGFLFGHPQPVQEWFEMTSDSPELTRVSAIVE